MLKILLVCLNIAFVPFAYKEGGIALAAVNILLAAILLYFLIKKGV